MVPARANAQPDRILDAALACIARVGVAKTTLDDVAREPVAPGPPFTAASRAATRCSRRSWGVK